jgi:nitrogen-specific signal transduction histidine kinase/CheY-like chemotaxis protein
MMDRDRLIGVLCVARDITDRKKMEEKLAASQKMEAIGTLAGGIAHDFNNIMGIIIGNTELALEDIPDWNPAHNYLEEIKIASRRASGVVRQILSFSRKTKQEFKPVSVVSVIKDAFQLLRSTIPATVDIRMNFNAAMDMILADPIQIHQVVMNLCINASHAMERSGGTLEITTDNIAGKGDAFAMMPEETGGGLIRIRIRDTGPGIDSEILGRIFDPYFTTKEVGKGSGMGLAVVHGIVQNHNGTITAESAPGEGAAFTILFPVVCAEEEFDAEVEEIPPHGTESILFVDDEASIARMTSAILERLEYRVSSCTDPIEALALFQAQPEKFDLVITDMTMPRMNGVTLCEKMMTIRPDIPVIICTGHSSMIDEQKALDLGIDAFVMKPVQTKEIAKTIRAVLGQGKAAGQPVD